MSRWKTSGRPDVAQFQVLESFAARASRGDIIYPVFLCHAALSGQGVAMREAKFLMPTGTPDWAGHVSAVTAAIAAGLKELQAWEPEAPSVQHLPAGQSAQDVQTSNQALYSRTVHGLEMFPLQRRLHGITLATHGPEVQKYMWHIPSELPSDPSVWIWPGEAKSMYINAKITYVLCFEQLGPKELSKQIQCCSACRCQLLASKSNHHVNAAIPMPLFKYPF